MTFNFLDAASGEGYMNPPHFGVAVGSNSSVSYPSYYVPPRSQGYVPGQDIKYANLISKYF